MSGTRDQRRNGRATMRQRVLNTVAAVVVAAPALLPAAVGMASAQGAKLLVFTQMFRRCDYSTNTHIGPTGFARPTAVLRSTGSELIADVQMATAIPNTPYDVRIIEMPRSSA